MTNSSSYVRISEMIKRKNPLFVLTTTKGGMDMDTFSNITFGGVTKFSSGFAGLSKLITASNCITHIEITQKLLLRFIEMPLLNQSGPAGRLESCFPAPAFPLVRNK